MIEKDEHPNFARDSGTGTPSDDGVGTAVGAARGGDVGCVVCVGGLVGSSGGGATRGKGSFVARVCLARFACGYGQGDQ